MRLFVAMLALALASFFIGATYQRKCMEIGCASLLGKYQVTEVHSDVKAINVDTVVHLDRTLVGRSYVVYLPDGSSDVVAQINK